MIARTEHGEAEGAPARDAGLQPERTGLAWSRTGLLAMLVALLCGRLGLSAASLAHLFAALVLAALAGFMFVHGHFHHHPEGGLPRARDIARTRRVVRWTGAGVALAGTVQALAVLARLLAS